MRKATISITTKSAGQDIKAKYQLQARKNGQKFRKLLGDVISYAVKHQDPFSKPLENPMAKGGSHISIPVSSNVKELFINWVVKRNTTQAEFANFLLEKALEMDIFDEL